MASLSRVLDHRIDEIIIEERRTFLIRLGLTLVGGAMISASGEIAWGLIWMGVMAAFERLCHVLTGDIGPNHAGSRTQRLGYILVVFSISAGWIVAPVAWWLADDEAMHIVGVLWLMAQMVHAQAFTFRSPVIFTVAVGLPAATLWTLTSIFSGLSGIGSLCVSLSSGSAIGYVLYSAYLNRISSKLVEESRSDFKRLANTDALTNLANRRMFATMLQHAVNEAGAGGTPFALLLIDLDKFKSINDTIGHDAGDAVLVEAARRLRETVGEMGHVARLGGDEFGILLPASLPVVRDMCGRIVDRIGHPISFAGQELRTAPSIGVAFCPEDAESDDALYKFADLGLYDVKRTGGGGWGRAATLREVSFAPHPKDSPRELLTVA